MVIRLSRPVLYGVLTAFALVALGSLGFLIGRAWLTSAAPAAVAPAPAGSGAAVAPVPQAPGAAVPKVGQNAAPPAGGEAAEANIPRVTIDDARQKFGQPTVLFVDTRSAGEYQQSRIKGAASLPLNDAEKRFNELPRDKDLILYCA